MNRGRHEATDCAGNQPAAKEIAMTKQETKTVEQAKKPTAEDALSEAALDQASGGALNAYVPAEAAQGAGGGTGRPAACDGSVRPSSVRIDLL
jgi:hypothetical protein